MSHVIARYTGPAVLSWDTGGTPVLAHLSLREAQGSRWGLSGERTWSGELQDLDGQTAWSEVQAHRRDELTLAVHDRSARVVVTQIRANDVSVTGSGSPPFDISR